MDPVCAFAYGLLAFYFHLHTKEQWVIEWFRATLATILRVLRACQEVSGLNGYEDMNAFSSKPRNLFQNSIQVKGRQKVEIQFLRNLGTMNVT